VEVVGSHILRATEKILENFDDKYREGEENICKSCSDNYS
jgi:hypothetical protein